MVGEFSRSGLGVHAAEVDDAGDTSFACGLSKGEGCAPVLGREGRIGGEGVDEVVGDVHTLECGASGLRVGEIGLGDLYLGAPWAIAQPLGIAGDAANGEPRAQKFGNQTPTHIAGDSGDGRDLLVGHSSSVRPFARNSPEQSLVASQYFLRNGLAGRSLLRYVAACAARATRRRSRGE